MQLQKQLNRIVDNKEYSKYLLVVPPQVVEELQWREGEELEHEVKEQALIIRKVGLRESASFKLAQKYARVKRK
jgi:antitoxin component of MazEF toxin-antitoxin module